MRVDFGMPALTLLGGDLWIGIDSFNCGFSGLRSLAYLPGSVSVQGCTSDGNGRSLLGGLLRVDGDLRLSLNGNAQVGFFPSVEVVAGNVMVDGANLTSADNFARRYWAQGRLRLSNVSSLGFLDDPSFRSLGSGRFTRMVGYGAERAGRRCPGRTFGRAACCGQRLADGSPRVDGGLRTQTRRVDRD